MTTANTNNLTRVFVYGSLLRDLGNHRVLGGAPCLATTCTVDAFTMLDLGAFPAVLSEGLPRYMAPVHGEVYEVDAAGLARLDRLEGYSPDGRGLYDRITVALCDGTEALMYVMHKPPTWRNGAAIVDESNWRTWLAAYDSACLDAIDERDTLPDDSFDDDECALAYGCDYCDCGNGCKVVA